MVHVCSKGDKMGTAWLGPTQPCCIPRAPFCCQGFAGEGKIPSSTVASHAERSCSLLVWFDQFLMKVLWNKVPFLPVKAVPAERALPTVSLHSSTGLCWGSK